MLQDTLRSFAKQVAATLQAELDAGAEIPFELADSGSRRGRASLRLYSPQTGIFLARRWEAISALSGHGVAVEALAQSRCLDRYLACLRPGAGLRTPSRSVLAGRALRAFIEDVFREQGDFALSEERLEAALMRLEAANVADTGLVTLLASLHGIAIASPQIRLAERLSIARPQTLSGLPEQALGPELTWGRGQSELEQSADHVFVVLELSERDGRLDRALAQGRQMLRELLRALRLYGDGRIAFGALAWACAGDGPFTPLALGLAGRPHGMLVVRAEQEDELRAFCSLLSRRAPREGPVAWALRRFEQGCERTCELDGLSDHLLALQALLEPERIAVGLFASRLAALCAPAQERKQAAARVLRAIELERDHVNGEAERNGAAIDLAREIADHLRALLRDVICGHLQPDLAALADELTLAGDASEPISIKAEDGATGTAARAPAAPEQERTVRVRRTRRRTFVEQAQDALPI